MTEKELEFFKGVHALCWPLLCSSVRPSELVALELAQQSLLETVLRGLGATSAEVAKTLKEAGITGEPDDLERCPLANVLRRAFPESRVVEACEVYARVDDVRVRWNYDDPALLFLKDFDNGLYPELASQHCPRCGRAVSSRLMREALIPEDVCYHCVGEHYDHVTPARWVKKEQP